VKNPLLVFDEVTRGEASMPIKNCTLVKPYSLLLLATGNDGAPDAMLKKEQGNEYFKEKRYAEAIDCYSRSIVLQPTAVAFANRAMAYIKMRRFEEAEYDCSETIDLDDRYVKAYSHHGTAKKELGKLLDAMDDFEFALRLEPENKELKKQYEEARRMYGESIAKKMTAPKTAYEFEATWKIFSGDLFAQTELLKIIAPTSLPKIFKDVLSAPLLMDIIRCVEHFFMENADFAVQFLENLTKIGRFDMTIMCLSTKDKAALRQMWDEVFVNKRVPVDLQEALIVTVNGVKGKQCILQIAFSHEH
jgi:tetratricopeptide (TPR) repeat protein